MAYIGQLPGVELAADATVANLTVTNTIDIDATGGIDEAVVGANTPAAGTFTTLQATSLDSTPIGGSTPAAGTFTTLEASTSLQIASGTTVTTILDEDSMASDSATALATQQSIKAYVDNNAYTGEFTVVTANTTIAAGDLIVTNSASALTLTLPASPTAGNTVIISNQNTGTVTVGRNGENINSLAEDGTLNGGTSTQLVYVNSTVGWGEL